MIEITFQNSLFHGKLERNQHCFIYTINDEVVLTWSTISRALGPNCNLVSLIIIIIIIIIIKHCLCSTILASFRSENEKEEEYQFCPREVWYFIFVFAACYVICCLRLKIATFAFFTLFFFFSFYAFAREKLRVTVVIRLYMDDTLDEEDVLMIFDHLEV